MLNNSVKYNFLTTATLVVLTILLLSYVSLAAPTGASATTASQGSAPASTAGTTTATGGEVVQSNLSAYQSTDKWVGFFGEVSGDIRLADSSNNIFYKWTIADPTGGVVYVTNATVTDWTAANIQPLYANDSLLPDFLITGTDSFNNTFTQSGTFNSPSLTISNVNYTTTWQAGAQGTTFKTYALKSVTDKAMIWAGNVVSDQTSYKGGTATADYQILAGVDVQGSAATFYFYLELP